MKTIHIPVILFALVAVGFAIAFGFAIHLIQKLVWPVKDEPKLTEEPPLDWTNRELWDKDGPVPKIAFEKRLLNSYTGEVVAKWTNSIEFHGQIQPDWRTFKWTDCDYIILDGVKFIVDRENQKLKNEDGTEYVIDPKFLK